MSHNLAQGNQLARIRTEYLIRNVQSWFSGRVRQTRGANRTHQDQQYLSELSDDLLKDIGLTRFDIDKRHHLRVSPKLSWHWKVLW